MLDQRDYLASQLSLLSYLDKEAAVSHMTAAGFHDIQMFDNDGTEAFTARLNDEVYIVFRGTEPTSLRDWKSDIRFAKVKTRLCRVHRGFFDAFNRVWGDIKSSLGQGDAVYLCGHSLGAALATITTAYLLDEDYNVQGLYTFGSPRVANKEFGLSITSKLSNVKRFVNNNDVVTRLPKIGYRHVGEAYYFRANGTLVHNPSSWLLFYDRLLGRLKDCGKIGTDGIKDHSMGLYTNLVKNALENTIRKDKTNDS